MIAGLAIGGAYLWALWHSIKAIPQKTRTKTWFLLNALARVLAVIISFYYLSSGDFVRIAALLLGFMIIRYIGIKKIIKKIEKTVVEPNKVELKEI